MRLRLVIALVTAASTALAVPGTAVAGGEVSRGRAPDRVPAYVGPAPVDLSGRTWSDAFRAMTRHLEAQYAFTEWKGIDFAALYRRYAPDVAAAQRTGDRAGYQLAVSAYMQRLRDGHASASVDEALVSRRLGGSYGLILTRLESGAVAVTWLQRKGPAATAGIRLGDRITRWDGAAVGAALREVDVRLSPPQPTDSRRDWERLRTLVRDWVGHSARVGWTTRSGRVREARLVARDDGGRTWDMTDLRSPVSRGEIPTDMVEEEVLPGNVGYVRVVAEIDLPESMPGVHEPTLTQFRTAIAGFAAAEVTGIVIDLRGNAGGSDQMVADMLGSFADPTTGALTGPDGFYEYQNYRVPGSDEFEIWVGDEVTGEYVRPGGHLSISPATPSWTGPVVALVDNACISSGEGLAMGIARLPRGAVVGFMGTNGSFGMAGGGAAMPDGVTVRWPYGQSLGRARTVQLDSRNGRGGVRPDVRVPSRVGTWSRHWRGEDVALAWAVRTLPDL